jgi:hypothetical protein
MEDADKVDMAMSPSRLQAFLDLNSIRSKPTSPAFLLVPVGSLARLRTLLLLPQL